MGIYTRILESLNLNEAQSAVHWHSLDLTEAKPETAAQKAQKAGLVSKGGGAWAKEKGGKTVARTDGDKLVAVSGDEEEPTDAPPEEKPKKKPEKLDTDDLKAKQANLAAEIKKDGVGPVMDYNERLTDLKSRLAWEEENQDTVKERKAIDTMIKTLDASDMPKNMKDAMALSTAIGFAYGSRKNTGVGLASLGEADRDALVANQGRIEQMYDDAIPKEVEKGVRSVRKLRFTEQAVRDSFKALPEKLQSALQRKGKVGDSINDVGGHFNGYEATDPENGKKYVTSDFRDPNIEGSDGSDEPDTDKLKVKRGNTGNANRGVSVWRMYLEQGGIDAYTGMPLDLEAMDLEHVVGYNNSDDGAPSTEDFGNREHERNQVLCSSRANQQKSDQNVKDFYGKNVDPLKDMDTKDFEAREGAYKTVNQASTVTEQTALRLQGDVRYEVAGTSETTTDPEKAKKSESGVPKVASATLGENVTADVLQKEFEAEDSQLKSMQKSLIPPDGPVDDPEDVKTIKKLKSKVGRRIIQAMGLPRGTTDVDGRRTNAIYGTDAGYRTFATAMASRDYGDRQEMKDAWADGIALVGTKETRDLAGSSKDISQMKIFDMYIRGDVKGLKNMGLKVSPEDKKKMGARGNILEPKSKNEQYKYESLASAYRRRGEETPEIIPEDEPKTNQYESLASAYRRVLKDVLRDDKC